MEQNDVTGFVDLHCHLLPGIDDGCESFNDTLDCIRRLKARGFVGSVCTPHILRELFPNNTPAKIAEHVAVLRRRLADAGEDYQLWAGGEVRIIEGVVDWLGKIGVPTLGPSRHVLIDYFGRHWPAAGDELIDYLFEAGYQPVLAHPERMDFADDEWQAVVDRLLARSVLLQGNLNSMVGGEGNRAQSRMLEICERDGYFVIASDSHRPSELDGRIRAVDLLEKRLGIQKLQTLLGKRPQQLVGM